MKMGEPSNSRVRGLTFQAFAQQSVHYQLGLALKRRCQVCNRIRPVPVFVGRHSGASVRRYDSEGAIRHVVPHVEVIATDRPRSGGWQRPRDQPETEFCPGSLFLTHGIGCLSFLNCIKGHCPRGRFPKDHFDCWGATPAVIASSGKRGELIQINHADPR